jgi:ABC-type dipeptide/oligopeptide/nickel transport system permease subunit
MREVPAAISAGRQTFWTRYRQHYGALAGLVVMMVLTVVALLAPSLAPYDPMALGDMALSVPSWSHPMGTDHLGRDILSAGAWGIRISLLVGCAPPSSRWWWGSVSAGPPGISAGGSTAC